MKLTLLLFTTALALAQQPNTTGSCSPIAANNRGIITIRCSGLSVAERKLLSDIPTLINKILASQVDPKVFFGVLDDIKSGQMRIENGVLRIEGQVTKIARGAIETYDFNGMKRVQSRPGFIDLQSGESELFKQVLDIYKAKNWQALAAYASKKSIKSQRG